jgi:hypothetical protein
MMEQQVHRLDLNDHHVHLLIMEHSMKFHHDLTDVVLEIKKKFNLLEKLILIKLFTHCKIRNNIKTII